MKSSSGPSTAWQHVSNNEASAPASSLDLIAAVVETPVNWYAAVDDVVIDGLPERFSKHGRSCAIVFRAEDVAGVQAGPWLVALPNAASIDAVLTATERKPAMVFWSWPDDFAALRRDLRRLDLVRIPQELPATAHRTIGRDRVPERSDLLATRWRRQRTRG